MDQNEHRFVLDSVTKVGNIVFACLAGLILNLLKVEIGVPLRDSEYQLLESHVVSCLNDSHQKPHEGLVELLDLFLLMQFFSQAIFGAHFFVLRLTLLEEQFSQHAMRELQYAYVFDDVIFLFY